jgi:hypothetical protein
METKIVEITEAELTFYGFKIQARGGILGQESDWEFYLSVEGYPGSNKTYHYDQELIADEEALQQALTDLMVFIVQKRSEIKMDYSFYEEETE